MIIVNWLENEESRRIETQEDICNLTFDYFAGLFADGNGNHGVVIDKVRSIITTDDNLKLVRPFMKEELKEATLLILPDGFNLGFYHRFWGMCGEDVFQACCMWLAEGAFPSSVNDTTIAIILKFDNPRGMKDLRPISLCNVVFKFLFLSEVLAKRLKNVLDKCVSEEQSAFVSGSINDNVLVVSEILHAMKCKRRGKQGDVALKIDISKAYDRIDWDYVKAMLSKLGFHTDFVGWIMLCVSSVRFFINVNEDMVGPITP